LPAGAPQNPIGDRGDRGALAAGGDVCGAKIEHNRRLELASDWRRLHELPREGRPVKDCLSVDAYEVARFALEQLANRLDVNKGKVSHGRGNFAGGRWLLIGEAAETIADGVKVMADAADELGFHREASAIDLDERGVDAVDARSGHAADNSTHQVASRSSMIRW
jgi:hypothetical protein